MEKRPVHLVMITTNNNNKFYDMTPRGDLIEISYGRIGATCTKITKPIGDWDKIYNSKIKKGYIDKSELIDYKEEKKPEDPEYEPLSDPAIQKLVDFLIGKAKETIQRNYKVSDSQISEQMIVEAQALITQLLSKTKALSAFNQLLLELFMVIPRKMSNVNAYLATSLSNIPDIIQREQDLLDVVKTQVQLKLEQEKRLIPTEGVQKKSITILDEMGIAIEQTTETDVKQIKEELSFLAPRYKNSWKIRLFQQEEKFQKFCQEYSLKPSDLKLLWHGTRTENIWSILKTSYMIRPTNAVISGHMFGYGIYSATNPDKSLKYTSIANSYWAHGSDASGFMLLNQVAYGKPYDVYSFNTAYYDLDWNRLRKEHPKCISLHAHKDKRMLRNDEIVVYREDQINPIYLVELE